MLEEARVARIARALRGLGYEPCDDNIKQFDVFLEALDVYIERTKTRGQLWKDFNVQEMAMHLRSKGARIQTAAGISPDSQSEADGLSEEIRDSSVDAINYAAFAERHRRAGKWTEGD